MDRFFAKELPKNRKKSLQVHHNKIKKATVKTNENTIYGNPNTLSKPRSQSYLDFGQVCLTSVLVSWFDSVCVLFSHHEHVNKFHCRSRLVNPSRAQNVICCMYWEWKRMKRITASIVEVDSFCTLIVYQYRLCVTSGSREGVVAARAVAEARKNPATDQQERIINTLKWCGRI